MEDKKAKVHLNKALERISNIQKIRKDIKAQKIQFRALKLSHADKEGKDLAG